LKLIPAAVALARAEIGHRREFARLFGASVPDNWPPKPWQTPCPCSWDGWRRHRIASAGSIGRKLTCPAVPRAPSRAPAAPGLLPSSRGDLLNCLPRQSVRELRPAHKPTARQKGGHAQNEHRSGALFSAPPRAPPKNRRQNGPDRPKLTQYSSKTSSNSASVCCRTQLAPRWQWPGAESPDRSPAPGCTVPNAVRRPASAATVSAVAQARKLAVLRSRSLN
jgi:hypothetical protein